MAMAQAGIASVSGVPLEEALPCGVRISAASLDCPLRAGAASGSRGGHAAEMLRVSDLLWRLDGFNKLLLSAAPVVELTPALGREVCRALGFARMVFLRADFAHRQLAAAEGWGMDAGALAAMRMPFEASPWVVRSMMSGVPLYTASTRMHAVLPASATERLGLGPLLCVPVQDAAGPLGAMLLDRDSEHFTVGEEAIEVARAVGRSLGEALQAAGGPGARSCTELRLTPRQLEILRMLGRGLANKQIAQATGLSVFTVRDHVSALLHALDVANRSAAVVRAWQLGLLDEPSAVGTRS